MADDPSLAEFRAQLSEAAQRLKNLLAGDSTGWAPAGVGIQAAGILVRTVLPALQVLIAEIEELRRRAEVIAEPIRPPNRGGEEDVA
jgi:hypothetical protein